MKKIIFLLTIVLFSFSSIAQDLTNQFYFRVGYSSPSWTQYGMEKDKWESATSKIGATFEIGSIFMLKGILNSDKMSLGINADYLYVTYGEFEAIDNHNENLASMRVGSKIGPSFTFSPVNKMAIDVYTKLDIAWGTAAVIYEGGVGDADDYYSGYGTMGFSTGLNFRYGILMLGIEYNTINPKLESDDFAGTYFGNPGDPSDSGDKSSMPCMNFTIGLSF